MNVAAFVCLLSCLVLFLCSARADQLSADEILKKVSDTYQHLQSYQITAERTDQIFYGDIRFNNWAVDNSQTVGGLKVPPGTPILSPVKSEVELAKVNPGKVRLEYKAANLEALLVSDGLSTWIYLPKKKQYAERSKSASAATGQSEPEDTAETSFVNRFEDLLVSRFRDLPKFSSDFVLEKDSQIKVGGDKIDCYVLKRVTPNQQQEIWVDKVRFIVWRSVNSDPIDNPYNPKTASYKTSTVELKTAHLNAKLEDSLFQFVPPDKAKKVDSLNPPTK
jgi:outer membrane lipoprotein-sorting protein